jgi:hypothetical protein
MPRHVGEQMEEGWQRKVARVRASGSTAELADLQLDPGLPFRGRCDERVKEANMGREEFDELYLEGVRKALWETEIVSFYPFMEVVFEHIDVELEKAIELNTKED